MAGLQSRVTHTAATTAVAAPAGTAADPVFEPGTDIDEIAMEINVTVAGTTGTYALEGSMDGTNWFGIETQDSADISTSASALTAVYTSTGRRMRFAKTDMGKFWRYYRVNPSVVTGQTFSATLWCADQD